MEDIDVEKIRERMDILLAETYAAGGSDLHVCSGIKPVMRKDGLLVPVCSGNNSNLQSFFRTPDEPFTSEELKAFIEKHLISLHDGEGFDTGSLDASYVVHTKTNEFFCRVNAFYDSRGISIAFRLLRKYIPSMDKLRIPKSVQKLRNLPHGLIVVTGATGSGKSTTIASMLEAINQERAVHIVTIENPIEYRYDMKKALISQREVGKDCKSFLEGLRDVLRQDPDVILVGEMRDTETIETALAAAETGHLVFSTLHSGTVVEAIDRFVQYFPADRHKEIRNELANSFGGIIAQRLYRSNSGGRIAAFEILLATDITRNLIRTANSFRLKDYMFPNQGMQTMEESVQGLRNKHLIS